jgi:hypothetical protein
MHQIMSDAGEYVGRPKIIANNTVQYERENGDSVIRLHHTDIVTTRKNGDVVGNTGGWQTVTTKERLNRYLPVQIYSEKGVWIVRHNGNSYTWQDGITFTKRGKVKNAGADPKEIQKLRKVAKKYAKDYMQAFRAGDIPRPSSGDCWGCCMKTSDGKTPMGGKSHMLSHIEESYFVPSLLVNACERFGVSMAARNNVAVMWSDETAKDNLYFPGDFIWDQLEKAVRRWTYQELGLAV